MPIAETVKSKVTDVQNVALKRTHVLLTQDFVLKITSKSVLYDVSEKWTRDITNTYFVIKHESNSSHA